MLKAVHKWLKIQLEICGIHGDGHDNRLIAASDPFMRYDICMGKGRFCRIQSAHGRKCEIGVYPWLPQ